MPRFARMLLGLTLLVPAVAGAQNGGAPRAATRDVFLDRAGVVRWTDDRGEVALFGANYTLPSASDYRAAGYLGLDRRKLIDEDMAHFARMGWDGVRVAFWGDWESADPAGNLIRNDHLDLMDYLVAKARERGIYILFSPIQTYDAGWPDALGDSVFPGFGRVYGRGGLGTRPEAIAAQANYLRQILRHVNPYTGVALKDEPAILFIELVNEPWHHPEDLPGSIRYINALADAVRSTGCRKLIFYNVSQDFRIAAAIRGSRAQGVTFGWYPTGLNSGHELRGNYLRGVDAYDSLRVRRLAGMPRIVYEFDSPDLRTGYMYPAMARTFRSVGTQFAAMFAYDMLGTASRNLGWQTHYLNLVYTPRKAMSAVIAAEAMRRLPRNQQYGAYPANTRFGDFRVSYEENLGELAADDAFLYAGTTRTVPPHPERLARVAGYGSSPVVGYDGEGVYFLDRVRPGVWRLEVYPDAVPIRDPFEMPSRDRIVTRAVHRAWEMRISLPDLGPSFSVRALAGDLDASPRAQDGRFTVTPGVYLLSARGDVAPATLPRWIGRVGMAEYHAPPRDTAEVQVEPIARPQYLAGTAIEIGARVAAAGRPDSVTLSIRPLGVSSFRHYAMRAAGGYEYRAAIPADSLLAGPYEYAVTLTRGLWAMTYPEGVRRRPWEWDYSGHGYWTTEVVRPGTPLRLFTAGVDAPRLAFSRIGDAIRQGLFRIVPSAATGEPALHLELPVVGGFSPEDYTASLVIAERVEARAADVSRASGVRVRLRGVGPAQTVHLTLVEKDGTGWSAAVAVDSTWAERTIPLADFRPARAVMLPEGYPGEWNYWMAPAEGRGGSGDTIRLPVIERIQFSLRRPPGAVPRPGTCGVEIESVTLTF
ncbi:hypothetical protein [Longimicrobium sp.]|uniref:hypothetical protein n=1 Tax=Longimicrobium sp. TaxID=2029185 RepID=UPI002BB5E242|nr:hypothetical protein [Longimicrobium sp.]HSU13816.1 hypothetical protein [Longimicrobium sp.]